MTDHLLDVNQVADLLRLSPGTVYHLVSQRRLPCVHLSARCLRFRRSDIDAWIAAKVDDTRAAAVPTRRRKF